MNKIFLPLSIIIAGLIIAGAVVYSKKGASGSPTIANNDTTSENISIREVGSDDHILGNPDADIVIVEYSDYECPFCAKFHPTMEKVMEKYGKDGKVAWVYRHMPLDQIHADARPASEASECVASIGGNDKFWEYSKLLFEGTPNTLKSDKLKSIAESIGIDSEKFNKCVSDKEFANRVERDFQDGMTIARTDPQFGTPYSIIISKDGKTTPIKGNLPYESIAQTIDSILSQ